VATAGLLAALKIKGIPFSDLHKERIVIAGAGSAGNHSSEPYSKSP
jgi:malic enzyme